MSRKKVNKITSEITTQARNLLGNNLKAVILYGSYARGDFDSESDIDIMILVKNKESELKAIEKKVSDAVWDIGMENKVFITAFVNNYDLFNSRLEISPFYRNVKNDGVELYAI